MDQKFRVFSAAYTIYSSIPEDQLAKTAEIAGRHHIPHYLAKLGVTALVKDGLIKIHRKTFTNSDTDVGIAKTPGSRINSLFKTFGITESEEVVRQKIQEALIQKRYKVGRKRKVVEELCSDEVPQDIRIARCGHASRTRYFKCEECLPVLPSDDGDDFTFSFRSENKEE